MVPVQALEATTSTFIGHSWGDFRKRSGMQPVKTKATWRQLLSFRDAGAERLQVTATELWAIIRWAFYSVLIALIIEVPLCLFMSFLGARPFARWLSGSDEVGQIAEHMWQTIDWCYVLYAVLTQLAAVLSATRPLWYLYQSLASNLLYVLPWAIVCQTVHLNPEDAWTYHSLVFGGSLVFSFFDVIIFDGLWWWTLRKGKGRVGRVRTL